jgi:hypothetical protein
MKKILLCVCVAFALTSCVTTVKTAKVADAKASLLSATVADLEVSTERISYTMKPSAEIRRAGLSNVKQAAIQEALAKNGNADVLVDVEYSIEQENNFIFGKRITSITVTGHPAKYKSYRSLHDSVWCDPVFRAGYSNSVTRPSGGGLFKRK